ncbi:MAG: 1-acyl-sn-glycerol-3-phosphate acyltransferase [Armatimonadetes bacterium]|nr:1-acyl-sn-glycerol-3-phosphate acyltransferase [Anaerolineae bacterium]
MRTKLQYPRRVVVRGVIKLAGRALGSIMARPQITGLENLPTQGPLILVGNHVAVIEAGMLAAYTPYPLEIMAAGDIPLDPRYAWMANLYGIIPIKRGTMDRDGMEQALSVLEQGGVVGLFPEGGIWETSLKQARAGVAWLSNKSQAPVIPIGFGGIEGAISAMGRLRRPRLVMNIGKLMPPVSVDIPGKSRKEALADSANLIMDQVTALIPEEERRIRLLPYLHERFEFRFILRNANGVEVETPPEMAISDGWGLSKFFHRPVMLDVFMRNLRLPVSPLNQVRKQHSPHAVLTATAAVAGYLASNPYFFHYRFGNDEGSAMTRAITQLHEAATWLHTHHPDWTMRLKPIRRYTLRDTQQEIVEDEPSAVQEI